MNCGLGVLAQGQAGRARIYGFEPPGLTSRKHSGICSPVDRQVRLPGTNYLQQCARSYRLPREGLFTEGAFQSLREYLLRSKICAKAIVSCDVVWIG